MKCPRALYFVVGILLLASATAQARISHGISGILVIDTVTAVNDDAGTLPKVTTIAAIYPNPFNPRTMINFELAEAGPVELAIYDVRGRLVRVMDSSSRSVGRYQATWDGLDDSGRAVPTGTYFCRLSTTQGSQTKKMMLAR
jgi:hypothetical protein